jgi:hypothetical protein
MPSSLIELNSKRSIKYPSSKMAVSHYGLVILGNVGHLTSSMKKPTMLGWYNDTGIFLRRKKLKRISQRRSEVTVCQRVRNRWRS